MTISNKTASTVAGLVLTILCTASCRDNLIEIDSPEKESFLRETTEGIYKNGKSLFKFDTEHHQKAVNPDRVQYRIQTDEQDTCLNVTLEALPGSPGVHITTSIDYRSPGELISSMSSLECSRVSDNKIWLWSPDSRTGIILGADEL